MSWEARGLEKSCRDKGMNVAGPPFRRVFMSEAGGLDARSPTSKYEAGGW
jgi:hypothetical protein